MASYFNSYESIITIINTLIERNEVEQIPDQLFNIQALLDFQETDLKGTAFHGMIMIFQIYS